jgi:arylsulfatase A-like enzyme
MGLVAATLVLGMVLDIGAVDGSVVAQVQSPTAVTKSGASQRQGPYVLVLVIDAARFDEFNLAQMPNLARVVAGGTTYNQAWVGQMPSLTETSHATIGTGVLPARHLIIGDTWRVPGTNSMSPDLLNRQITQTGYLGKLIKQSGAPTLASFVHQHYKGSVVVALSGHKIYAADAMGAGDADFVAYGALDTRRHYVPFAIPGHMPSKSILGSSQLDLPSYPRKPGIEDAWTTTLAEKFLFKYHPRLMMVNLPEVDVYGHAVGTQVDVMQPLMRNIDGQIGRLLAAYGRAGLLSQTTFVITSDHAMVPSVRTVSSPQVAQIVQRAGGVALTVGHGDYCAVWLKDLASVPRVAAALATANLPGVDAVYAKDETGQYALVSAPARLADPMVNQAYLDLLATFDSAESPDVVLLYDENTITTSPYYQKIGRKGDHGGASWGAQHIPLILMGPTVRQGYRSDFPARLVDIAPTIETIMGISPQHQDGVPLSDALLHPPLTAVQMQGKVSARLLDDVKALEQEAALRPNLGQVHARR